MTTYPAVSRSSTYPVVYEQDPAIERNRLTVFFRLIMVIPHMIVAFFYFIAASIVVCIAWFAIVFTGRYPEGMYNFVAGALRFNARVNSYFYLVTDTFPPFDGAEHPEYPVQLHIPPQPQESYNRVTTFFRVILLIPVGILLYIFNIWLQAVAIAIWVVGVIMGKTAPGLVSAHRFPLAFAARAGAYGCLLTDRWPPLED
jgi:hypothetical protein